MNVTAERLTLERPDVPLYREGRYDGWELRIMEPSYRGKCPDWGYVTGYQLDDPFPTLFRHGQIVASGSRLAREAHATHVKWAHGRVVVCGLGIGLAVHAMAQKGNVRTVEVVESNQSLIDMVRANAQEFAWPNMDKVRYLDVDADSEELGHYYNMTNVDYLYVDLQPQISYDPTVDQAALIGRTLTANEVSFFGQEVAFMQYLWHMREEPLKEYGEATLDHFDEWCLVHNAKFAGRDSKWLDYAAVVFANYKQFQEHMGGARVE